LHQRVASHRLLLNVGVVAEVGQALDEVVMDFLAGRALADDEGLTHQILETDFRVAGVRMLRGQDRENALRPQMLALAIRPGREAGQEGDVELMLPHSGDVFGGIPVREEQFHRLVALPECPEKIGQEAGGQRREDTDPDLTILAASDRGHFRPGQPDLGKRLATALDELFAGLSELHAPGRA